MLQFAIIRVGDEDPAQLEVLLTADVEDALVAAARSQTRFRKKRHESRVRSHYKQAVDTLHQQTITLP